MKPTPRLRTLSIKLALVVFGVVAGALAIVYLAVIPQLESRLADAKIRELQRGAPSVVLALRRTDPFAYQDSVGVYAATLDARVVVFRRLDETTLLPFADSSGLLAEDVQEDPIALEAAASGLPTSGHARRNGRVFAEVAMPVNPETIVLFSANSESGAVALVRRTILIAAAAALLVSGVAGFLAAWGFTRRLRQLEAAAERIAGGDFEKPVVDPGSDEVAQLARAFEAMRVRLAQLDRARREFIANASHELRTPLFSLGGFLELLADEDVDEETRREFLRETRAQVDRLTKLATDLLDLSRIDAGQLDVKTVDVDLKAVAAVVADEFRPLAEATDHPLEVAAAEHVHALADDQRVLQVARVLVENALRHTPPTTPVEISVEQADGRATLAVRDEGPGIPEAEQEQLFERFYRGSDGRAAGSGLGLAIASELAKRMNGRVSVCSQRGETTFRLELPSPGGPIPHENGAPRRDDESRTRQRESEESPVP